MYFLFDNGDVADDRETLSLSVCNVDDTDDRHNKERKADKSEYRSNDSCKPSKEYESQNNVQNGADHTKHNAPYYLKDSQNESLIYVETCELRVRSCDQRDDNEPRQICEYAHNFV